MAGTPRLAIRTPDRYLFLATARLTLAYLLLLFLVLLLDRSLDLVAEMSALGVDISFLAPLVAAVAPFSLNLSLPAAFGVALVLAIDRLTRNREFEALSAMGLSPLRVALPMVAVGLLAAGASLGVSGWLEPHGRHAYRQLQSIARHHLELQRFQPEAIYAVGDGFMITADGFANGEMREVLLWTQSEEGDEIFATSERGWLRSMASADRISVGLEDGRLLSLNEAERQKPAATDFARLVLNRDLGENLANWPRGRDEKEMTLPELLGAAPAADGARARAITAELWMRLARALTIPLMPLLVLPLIASNPTGRRGSAIFVVAGLLMLTHHGIGLARELGIESRGWPAAPQVLLLLALAATVALAWRLGRNMPGPTPLTLLSRLRWPARGRPAERQALPLAGKGLLLPRLIAWEVARSGLGILLFMTGVLLIIDLIDAGETLVRAGGGPAAIATFLALRLGAAMLHALPLAAIGGPLLAFLGLRESRQLLIVQSLGISPWRILGYASAAALATALLAHVLSERLVPLGSRIHAGWWAEQRRLAGEFDDEAPHWFRLGSEVVRIAGVAQDGRTLVSPTIIRRDADGRLRLWIAAARATYSPAGWTLFEVRRQDLLQPGNLERQARLGWPAPLVPADARRLLDKRSDEAAQEAARALAGQAPTERGRPYYATRMAHRWALPAMPFVMLLLAIPVIVSSEQSRRIARGVILTALAGLAFLVADGSLRIMGATGMLPPLAAVWLAPLLFAGLGLLALLRSERPA